MRVLLSAFSCSPGKGSEPGIGWNWLRQVQREHEVWLMTRESNRASIQPEITSDVHVAYVPTSALYAWLADKTPGLNWVYYYWWQWKAYRVARKLHAQVGFHLVHHVTFGSWRVPSFLCLLPVPFVWGPVGGGESVPRELRTELGIKSRLFEAVRDLCQAASRWDPFVRQTVRRAAAILAANADTARMIPGESSAKLRVFPNAGLSVMDLGTRNDKRRDQGELAILFVARLEPRKGGSLALKAFAAFARTRAEGRLVIVGDGPDRQRLERLAANLGVGARVQFAGMLPRDEVLRQMASADILLFPSLRDSGGFVLLEAMNAEKPVVCLDLGGPRQIVSPESGVKLTPQSSRQVVDDLASALHTLAGQPELRQRMGLAGRQRVLEFFEWSKKGGEMLKLYAELRDRKPAPAKPVSRG